MGGQREVGPPPTQTPHLAPLSREEPRNTNLGMYSWIEQHGDRQTTGDLQFEEIWRLGHQISSNCQSPMLSLPPHRSFRRWNHQHLHENQHQQPSRNNRATPGGVCPPRGGGLVSRGLLMLVFMQMLMIPTPKGSTSRSSTRIRGFRAQDVGIVPRNGELFPILGNNSQPSGTWMARV